MIFLEGLDARFYDVHSTGHAACPSLHRLAGAMDGVSASLQQICHCLLLGFRISRFFFARRLGEQTTQ